MNTTIDELALSLFPAGRTSRWRALAVLAVALVVLLSAGCPDGIKHSASTGESTVSGMGPVLCPVDWSGTQLDDTFAAAWDEALSGGFQNLAMEVDAEIARRDLGIVRRIELSDLVIRMTEIPAVPGNQNTFGFIRDVRLYVESSQDDTELPRQLLGDSLGVPDAATSLSFRLEEVNLKPYFEEGFVITTEVEPRTCLRDDVTFVIDFSARIYL